MSGAHRRLQILEQARELFLEAGESSAVSLRQVAHHCGIDEALIYRHFGTKDQLYMEAVSLPVQQVIEDFVLQAGQWLELHPEQSDPDTAWNLLHAFVRGLLSLPTGVVRSMGILLFGPQEQAKAFYDDVLGPALTSFEAAVGSGMSRWTGDAFSVETVIRMTFASGFWMVAEYAVAERELDVDAVAREITERLIYGLTGRGQA